MDSPEQSPAPPDLPAYQYPCEGMSCEKAARWKWMQDFYEREVSRPASADETIEEVRKRVAQVKPTPEKLAYLDMELITFPHFGMSTQSGHQQGSGDQDPASFNPVDFDAHEWVRFHKSIGAKMIVFVAKHHDGYFLWPSGLNDYSIKSSPWRDGKGDMIREIADACREGGLKLGLYISLWDKHDPRCDSKGKGPDDYTQEWRETYQLYIEQQLTETLVPYGEITELWFDGAGTRGTEDWNRIFELIHHYQPKCLVAMCGPGIRWCGNESAIGDAVNWNVLPMLPELQRHHWVGFHYDYLISKRLAEHTDDLSALQGKELFFIPQECDTPVLKNGWHWDGVGEPRPMETYVNAYYASIGSGAVLIISPSPDPKGVFSQQQVDCLQAWRKWIDESFSNNLFCGAQLTLSGAEAGYQAESLLRDERDQPCHALDSSTELSLLAEFAEPRTFNNLMVQEVLDEGQRISAFVLEAWQDDAWAVVAEGRTVGNKRVLPFSDVTTDKVCLRITESRDRPTLRFAGLYKAWPYREGARSYSDDEYQPALAECETLRPGMNWSYYEDPANGFLPYQEIFSNLDTTQVAPVATGHTLDLMSAVDEIRGSRNREQHFAMRFDGYFHAPARAVYQFRARANSGCRVFVNGQSAIENDESGGQNTSSKTADAALLPGLHRLTVLYYFGTANDPKLSVSVEWPGNEGGIGFGWNVEQRLQQLLVCEAQ
jgi:alpha-L-fucosidase